MNTLWGKRDRSKLERAFKYGPQVYTSLADKPNALS